MSMTKKHDIKAVASSQVNNSRQTILNSEHMSVGKKYLFAAKLYLVIGRIIAVPVAVAGYTVIHLIREFYPELGETLGDALLRPTKIYVRALRSVREAGVTIKGCSHVTGGGFYENIPRMLPDGVRACVKKDSYEVPAIFRLLQKRGNIEEHMMYNTFNMGIGMVLALKAEDADKAIAALEAMGEKAYLIGSIAAGEKGVDVC